MNISIEITGELLKYLDRKTAEEGYKSRSETIRDAIRRMIREDLRQEAKVKQITEEDLEGVRDGVAKELLRKDYRGYA